RGPRPTPIGLTMPIVRGFSLKTLLPPPSAIHTLPAPNVTPAGDIPANVGCPARVFVRGSISPTTELPNTAQTEPSPAVTLPAPDRVPIWIVSATAFTSVSKRETLPSRPLAVHTAPAWTATPVGVAWSGNLPSWRVSGSMRDSVLSAAFATQTDSAPNAIADGRIPTGTVPTTLFCAGSIIATELGGAVIASELRRSRRTAARTAAPASTAAGITTAALRR